MIDQGHERSCREDLVHLGNALGRVANNELLTSACPGVWAFICRTYGEDVLLEQSRIASGSQPVLSALQLFRHPTYQTEASTINTSQIQHLHLDDDVDYFSIVP